MRPRVFPNILYVNEICIPLLIKTPHNKITDINEQFTKYEHNKNNYYVFDNNSSKTYKIKPKFCTDFINSNIYIFKTNKYDKIIDITINDFIDFNVKLEYIDYSDSDDDIYLCDKNC